MPKYYTTKLSEVTFNELELVTDPEEIADILNINHIRDNYTALLIDSVDDLIFRMYGTTQEPSYTSTWDILISE